MAGRTAMQVDDAPPVTLQNLPDTGGIEGKKEEKDPPKGGHRTEERRFVEHVVFRGFTFRHTDYSLEMASVYTPDDGVGLGTTEKGEFLTPYFTWGIYLDDFSSGTEIVGNIVAARSGALIRVSRWHDQVFAECDRNLYCPAGGDPAHATPKGPLAPWQAAGYDMHSVVADPLFRDPAKDDYTLRPDSPAFQLGFQPIDTSKIGVEGYQRPAGLP